MFEFEGIFKKKFRDHDHTILPKLCWRQCLLTTELTVRPI